VIKNKHLAGLVAIICLTIGVWQLGSAGWIYSKAYLARFLINDAWQATLVNNSISKPWSWADTWPVAEISVPAIGLNEIVLSGDSGEALAFGPGLSNAGASFDSAEVKLISAHRDTHFRKLEYIAARDEIYIATPAGKKAYRVTGIKIVDSRIYRVDPLAARYDLVLATCYPFNAMMAGGHERFIVEAEEIHPGQGGQQAF
jgi:sortase A